MQNFESLTFLFLEIRAYKFSIFTREHIIPIQLLPPGNQPDFNPISTGGGVFHINFVCLLIMFLVLGRLPPNLVTYHNWVLAKFSISKSKIDVSLLPW